MDMADLNVLFVIHDHAQRNKTNDVELPLKIRCFLVHIVDETKNIILWADTFGRVRTMLTFLLMLFMQ